LVNNPLLPRNRLLTAEEIEIRVWAFVVLMVTVILAGIVFFMLYSVTFVTQPIKSMAPIDMAYTKMLNDIVLLIVGGIGGVMSKKGVTTLSEKLASSQTPPAPTPAPTTPAPVVNPSAPVVNSSAPNWNFMGFQNPDLDESWRPGPPPTTPPDHLDPSREEIAAERASAKAEA
jgi:hypothetical protein